MQPYEDVEDTLPWILNDVVEFEGCFKIKIIKIHKVDHWGGKKNNKIHKVDHWSGKKFEILGHTHGLCGGHRIIRKRKYMQFFGKVWPLNW